MIKQAMADGGLAMLAAFGLVVFVAVFAGVCLWVGTRRRQEVEVWSSLPLADGVDPIEPRQQSIENPLAVVSAPSSRGCGKCENCNC